MGNNIYVAYALWLLTGWLGAHRIYLGKFITGFLMMGLFFVGYSTFYFIIGIPFLIIWGIWWLIDAFLVGAYVEKNLQKAELKGFTSFLRVVRSARLNLKLEKRYFLDKETLWQNIIFT